jgi:hypothetical protein
MSDPGDGQAVSFWHDSELLNALDHVSSLVSDCSFVVVFCRSWAIACTELEAAATAAEMPELEALPRASRI